MKDKDQQLIWEAYEGGDPLVAHVFSVLDTYGFVKEGNVWLLKKEKKDLAGDIFEDYAKITFTIRSDDQSSMDPLDKFNAAYGQDEIELGDEHVVAFFTTNAVVNFDPRQANRYDLTNDLEVRKLIKDIQEAWKEINR